MTQKKLLSDRHFPVQYSIKGFEVEDMLFNSADFIIFFVTVLFLYYALPYRLRWPMLLGASLIFYMAWKPSLVLLILFSAFVNFAASKKIYKARKRSSKKRFLILAMVINFGLLIIFKYLVFLSDLLMQLCGLLGADYPIGEFDIILPMGISFYTFQAAAYTIDVYRGDIRPLKSFFRFALFITFFPQLVAGPIERAKNLIRQLFSYHPFRIENISFGLKMMLIGFFKKVVIADRLAIVVDTIFNDPKSFGGISFIVGAFLFSIQIFCDFSGYSDIAIGAARTMGIRLIKNFDRPYFSKSIQEFWRRWHISLSAWFKDYVYIPLGGSRVSGLRWAYNIMITFLLSGLWHGANLTFLVWGGLHGIFQIIGRIKNRLFGRFRPKLFISDIMSCIITFCLVAFAWIFFRANSLSDAVYIITNLTSDIGRIGDMQYLYETALSWGVGLYPLACTAASVAILFIMELISFRYNIAALMEKAPFVLRLAFYYILALFILGTGVFDSGAAFIYFQF